ncbi:hypothetical protein EJD97_016000, partial [Solanum chilense]
KQREAATSIRTETPVAVVRQRRSTPLLCSLAPAGQPKAATSRRGSLESAAAADEESNTSSNNQASPGETLNK